MIAPRAGGNEVPRGRRRRAGLAAALLTAGAAAMLSACVATSGAAATPSGTVGLLLPESQTARYEASDHPTFARVVSSRCPGCDVLYANAGQDVASQQEQAESMLVRGADVLVLDAVDTVAAVGIVEEAHRLGAKVIAYDRFVDGADYYVSYDYEFLGYLMGSALAGALDPDVDPGLTTIEARAAAGTTQGPGVLLVQGAVTDPNSRAIADGAHRALEGTDIDVLAEYHTPDWSPDKATEWVEAMLTRYRGQVDGILAASDGVAGGAVAAAKAAGLDPVPPTTGQDGELAAVQRIVAGDQYMTIYKATDQQAATAAELAVRVLRGQDPRTTAVTDGVPTLLLAPRAVGADDIEHVIVDGHVYTADQICTPSYRAACEARGLVGGTQEEQG
ncbi:substrate-binding domain-containing protein [Myceligenerans indicum]|uniref:Sugar ABC transporter substrate-binding protein n=1 Tax=Myceligenerans indicum TaxID=2593663 RepID=A0ABS1LM73_9MICO|nr:substrate-binding domain-containing protein [Myceligenerans indicum]MBL0887370.1 sugar ABC transporter substrate-binding protein [Myceligenerans indicum]